MEYDVTQNRNEYIGGSDIPIIMGISPFKTRWTLLQEKAGLIESTFQGNKYTEYGNILEPQIRAYINQNIRPVSKRFEPNRVINGVIRCHTDGFNGECVLEIKTTSHIYEDVSGYKIYLVQLLKYMEENHVSRGKLAVYERPEDFDTQFDPTRLREYDIRKSDYKELLEEINREIDRFLDDLERLKNNPLLTEQDFIPKEMIELSNKVLAFENQLVAMKAIEKQLKEVKSELFDKMTEYGIKAWETPNGMKITRVDAVPPTEETIAEFDEQAFKEENPAMYDLYVKETVKKKNGRSGYVTVR